MGLIKKLLVGGVLLTAAALGSGCASTQSHISPVEDYQKNLIKNTEKYNEGIRETSKETAESVTASLNAQGNQVHAEANKSDKEKIREGYERANKSLTERKEEVTKSQEALEREKAFQIGRTYNLNKLVTVSNENPGNWELSAYTLQRSQDVGEQEPRVVNGSGIKATYTSNNRWQVYGKWEQDTLSKEETSDAGNLRLNSTANTYGAGIGYRIIDHKNHKLDANVGIFNRTETNSINGVIGMRNVNDKHRETITGAEAGLSYTFNFNDNVGIGAYWSHENYNVLGRNNGNAKTGNKWGIMVTVKSLFRLFGIGKGK